MKILCFAAPALMTTVLLPAAPLVIPDRDPQPGEMGWRPADRGTAVLNPPSFLWPHESLAHRYEIEWGTNLATPARAVDLPFNTYTHNRVLNPGTYQWRYRFLTQAGQTSAWSRVRAVTVPAEAIAFPMPHRAEQRARVPQQHPRLFFRPEDVARLRDLAQGRESARFAALREEADRVIREGPTPEPTQRGSARDKDNAEMVKYWWPNREQTQKACQEAEVLAFVYRLTGDAKYGEAARRWILHLASWDPDGPTNFGLNCEAAKPLIYRLPRAYDWAYDRLTPEDRARVQAVMKRRVADAWKSGEIAQATGHFTRPYNSHGNRIWHKVGECALAFLGEVPEAETWLDYAVNKFHACYPVWADDDGGWHEGVSYWGGYMSKAVWWLQASESALGVDGFRKPFFAYAADYPLYVAPPGSPNMGFGDLSYRPVSSGWGGFVDFLVRMSGAKVPGSHAPYWRWWAEQWGMKSEGGILGFLYAANLPAPPPAKAPTDLPPSKVFHGIGVASLHTTLLDSRQDVQVLFKSSPYGTQSHGHNAHNTFQLNAYGEPLLTTCVYRDLHGSRFHYNYVHSTVAQNGVLVNREGQIKHTAAPHGRIVDHRLGPDWDYVVGDATAAYGDRLVRYRRHVLLLKPEVVILWDDLEARQPSTFQFMLHALQSFEVNPEAQRLTTERENAGVAAVYLPPEPLAFRQWDGFDPRPSREFPNQWHVEASTRQASTQLGMLTVIVAHRAGQAVPWTARRLESETAIGLALDRGGNRQVVAFRKPGVTGPAALGELRFEGAAEVRRVSGGSPPR